MARPSLITQYLSVPLPTKSQQQRLPFRPETWEVDALYRSINRNIFDNQLTMPDIELGVIKKAWGLCSWEETRQRHSSWGKGGTWCTIRLSDKWFCSQWFVNILAHEMAHQYQWDIYRWDHQSEYGKEMHTDSYGHGPSFFMWRDRFAEHGLELKTSFGKKRWFKHQDFRKC